MTSTENPSRSRPLIDDLVAACNSLGSLDLNDGVYMKDSDCKACLREILRILHADDDQHQARILLGKLDIIGKDLIPLIVQYCDFNDGDQDLFKLILKTATNITSSIAVLFNEPPTTPETIKVSNQLIEGLYSYKQSFANEPKIWHTLNTYLRNIDDDETLFERILILIRNILHIPVDVSANLGIKGSSHSHELCLNHMDKSGMLSTFIKLASESSKGTEFCFHIMEIVYLMLRDQDPITVASATQPGSLKRKLEDNDQDKKKLLELMARDKIEREVRERNFRIPRFKTTAYEVKNLTSLGNQPMISRTLVTSRQDISFDTNKTQLRKAKNKKPLPMESNLAFHSETNNATTRVTASLKLFSKLFVEKVYANYMQQIKFNLMQKKAAESDETYYLWAISYFVPFARQLYLDMNLISESLSTSTIHYIQISITNYKEKLQLEKKRSLYEIISQRLHQAVRAYREILLAYQFIKPDPEPNPDPESEPGRDLYSRIQVTKKTIFSEMEYNTLILSLLKQYIPNKHNPGYVKDLIKTNHVYLELIEDYFKTLDDPERITYFMSSFCTPEILATYTQVLEDFRNNEAELNIHILKYFERVLYDCKNDVMLMQASLLRCLLEIHDYHSSLPGYDGFVRLLKQIMASFREKIGRRSWMIQELLFWKTRNDAVQIDNEVS